jgi:UDP-2,3-diacylglucosamine pyrophosphatase LpxH
MLAEMLQGQFEVHREWVHRTARGQRLLVMHGDQFDGIVPVPGWLSRLGDALYEVTLVMNNGLNNVRRLLKRPYWPLAERIKLNIGASVRYITSFEQIAASHARAQGYDGAVCGHIHRANLREIDGTLYCNTGDWVESCSALIERTNGELQLLRWPHGVHLAHRTDAPLVADGCVTAAAGGPGIAARPAAAARCVFAKRLPTQ